MKNGVKHYQKYDGMMLAKQYLPQVTPFQTLELVRSLADWEAIEAMLPQRVLARVDVPQGVPRKNVLNTRGYCDDVPRLLKTAQEACPDAAVVVATILNLRTAQERYLSDGGFCVAFDVNRRILIELAGKGFDGHEVTQGLAIHERWDIPWRDFGNQRLWLNRPERHGLVVDPAYDQHRRQRIEMLCDGLGCDREAVEAAIPPCYTSMAESGMFDRLMNQVIIALLSRVNCLVMLDWGSSFAVQGNFVDGRPEVWEIYTAATAR